MRGHGLQRESLRARRGGPRGSRNGEGLGTGFVLYVFAQETADVRNTHDEIYNISYELVKGNLGAGIERYVLP